MTTATPQRARRNWVYALFAASFGAWAAFFGLVWLAECIRTIVVGDSSSSLQALPMFAIFSIPVVVVVCFLVGAPTLLLAKLLKLTKWWQAALSGAGVGVLLPTGISLLSSFTSGAAIDSAVIPGAVLWGAPGACAGLAAWASLWLDRRGMPVET